MKMLKSRNVLLASFALLFTTLPVLAHHSFEAEFDNKSSMTLKGTFSKIDWINPHIYFYLDVKDDSGKVTTWTLESFPTGFMHRAGLTKDSFPIGEPVTVFAYLAKDGTKAFAWMQELTLSSGRKFDFSAGGHPIVEQPK